MQPSKMRFTVQSESSGGMLATHHTKAGAVVSDEPEGMGGSNRGPNPIEMLLASWAGCLVASARIVGQERGLELGRMRADAEAEIDPRSLQGDRSATAGILSAKAHLRISGHVPNPDWLKQEIEARCPVGQTLRRTGIPFEEDIQLDSLQ